MKVLTVFGTRPEAIKMAPLVKELARNQQIESTVCVTAQHREMLDQVLEVFEIKPDIDLNLMKPGQDLFDVTSNVLLGMKTVFDELKPDAVLVHGDTTTAMAAGLAGFYSQVPVGHVEAGLRTRDLKRPWPEELNRVVIDSFSEYLFAPTERSREALLEEGVAPDRIYVTGNTVIDALVEIKSRIENDADLQSDLERRFDFLSRGKRLVLITGHRRESFGKPFEDFCNALLEISKQEDVELIYPVHLNRNVQEPVKRILASNRDIHLVDPVDYVSMIYLMSRCHFIITDSGGIQEEAPTLGKPVLVTREVTERREALDRGAAALVGTDPASIIPAALKLLRDSDAYQTMAGQVNPFGDGNASKRIVEALLNGK